MASFDLLPGEQIIIRANLRRDKWKKWRCATCSLRCISTVWLAPICVPAYGLFGGSCREEEANSFELVLTNQNIYFRQKFFNCGFCCQETQSKTIPLDRIQDINIISDWIGDCCGVVDTPGEEYQVQVQTAAMGTPFPELIVISIENPRGFKRQVLEAKQRLVVNSPTGQSKTTDITQLLSGANQQDLTRIVDLLSRQLEEKKLHN
jgi:hypothetical protein